MMRFASIGSRVGRAHERPQDAYAHRAALLGMELQPEHPVRRYRGRDGPSVIDGADDGVLAGGLRGIRVHEIEVRAAGHAGEPGVRPRDRDLVPAGVRDADVAAQPAHVALRETEAGRSRVLLAVLEEELHPDAEAQKRDAAVVRDADHRVEAEATKLARAVAEVTDARKDDRPRGEELD